MYLFIYFFLPRDDNNINIFLCRNEEALFETFSSLAKNKYQMRCASSEGEDKTETKSNGKTKILL